jgi:2-succinyl-5-enolpyruvyl-6-hydroxy-3-cyclohexene-1-carboxylate synthase
MLDVTAEWAALLVDSLAAAEIVDVVVSPGSRSTPFVLAAARHPSLRLHPIVDERAAAFFALGQAKVTGRPSLLLCTSGTAGAHYLPAVIEASLSRTPLVILTADRPFELQGCSAPQTIDQIKLFGDHARAYIELGLPDGSDGALRALRRQAVQAVHASRWPEPGAVHLNARARKPLEPEAARDDGERAAAARAAALRASAPVRVFAPRVSPSLAGVDAAARACRAARRGVIVCGPAPIAQAGARADVRALAAATGFPLCAEATSQLRFDSDGRGGEGDGVLLVDGFASLVGVERFRRAAAPDLILQLGAPPTSGAWERYLAVHPDCPRIVVAPYGFCDPESRASLLLQCDVGDGARALAAALDGVSTDAAWRSRWRAANRAAWRAVDALVDDDSDALSEAAVARLAAASVPRGGVLAVGNSLPIRSVDSYCPASLADCAVWSQRGANGIDGLVAGAAGVAATGRPTTLLVGDVSLLHDLGGLAAARGPLVIVVVNNGGGRIFEQLPLARVADAPLELFTTPHTASFAAAAALHGHGYQCAETRAQLARALDGAHGEHPLLVEAVVPPHGAAELAAAVAARLDAALDAEGLV